MRLGEVVTRWAHNPKIVGSIPTAATKIVLTIQNKKTMITLNNIFDFAFFAAEEDKSLGWSTIVKS